jgi:transformation/transcription domain-associated protein
VTDGGKSKSRLRKELLQTCIRPVLLNLRDYTRLSVHLLRGLSRLLSLLSSWFNKTLGEKLLDHMQKWTDPNRMKSQKIWKEGEEPDVAATIVDLFVLLPHASHFVEPLVKTTIKLEACLPAFKSRHVFSPYRKPLARYLNKHCQYTVSFFFQRLQTPLYSELFQDLIRLPESKPLREYLSGRQCSVSLLNVCFERPLAIIRSEKTASGSSGAGMSPPKSSNSGSATELFVLHGIQPFSGPQPHKEASLRQDFDEKKKKLQILQQELVRTNEALQARASASVSEVEEAKRKINIAKTAFDRGAKDFNESKQRYAAEVAQSKAAPKSKQNDQSATKPMTTESLELQHQGFRLVETLIENDGNYLKDHNDVLRAFRWLWRSKGRYLRLQHEEYVPPRFHGESKLLASFLVNYSRNYPNDVDLLFELIRIFLQSSSSDFSFVRSFLADAVSKLSVDQKQQIIQRFFALLAGESTEEIKTLSMQLVVYPMLYSSFHETRGKRAFKEDIVPIAGNPESEKTEPNPAAQREFDFIDSSVFRTFLQEVLFHDKKPIICGDRLKVELLRMSNLLLEFVPGDLADLGKNLIKFCWALLKSDDASCKSWAYVVVCRFISELETPPKIILQVYLALLRSHQQEGKDLVRAALDLLVPALPKRLEEGDLRKTIEYTNRIMFEEGNSVPQLAHIWHTIVSHPDSFYRHRHQFVRYMINSLNRLGLPPNCPPENRALAVSIVELVMRWDSKQGHQIAESANTDSTGATDSKGTKRVPEEDSESDSQHARTEKKRKTSLGVVAVGNIASEDKSFLLDQNMVRSLLYEFAIIFTWRH